MSNKNTNKKRRVTMRTKGRYSPVKVNSNDAPHPPRRQGGKGPSPELAMVGAYIDRKGNPFRHHFAAVPELIEKTNSIQTVAGWMAWDQFRNEETRIDFIIDTLTTQSKWQQRGSVVHMGWHIPDILLILNQEGFCSSKQILQIVDGFEGVNKFNTKDWKENKELIIGPKPDVVTYIEVKGPVNFKMEFATYTDNRREKCLILNNTYDDRPLYQQVFGNTTTGEKLVDGLPAWQRYAPYDSILGDSVLTPKTKRVNADEERSKKEWTDRGKQQKTVTSKKPTQESQVDELLEAAKNGNKPIKHVVLK